MAVIALGSDVSVSVVKALSQSSEGQELMPQQCQAATVGPWSIPLCTREAVSWITPVPQFFNKLEYAKERGLLHVYM